MKLFILFTALFIGSLTQAKTCYQLSKDGLSFSRTPQLLCINTKSDAFGESYEASLEIQNPSAVSKVATYFFSKLVMAKCYGCNMNKYSNTTESLINDITQISFDGSYNDLGESGVVKIGTKTLYYLRKK